MTEPKKCSHTDQDYDEKVPRTLSTILLKEYEHLKIFSLEETEKIRENKRKLEKRENLECFICLREAFDAGLPVEEYKKRNKNRKKTRERLLDEIRETLHQKDENEKPIALCFSGGGIRSATFNLGVLQGLAKQGMLNQFHYLSTVSGGGYIGAWLSAWVKREEIPQWYYCEDPGIDRVQEKLNPENYTANQVEPEEITHLRAYSNYMSPRLGIFSSDTLTLIAVYLRNLLLNWTVLLPIIAGILMLPRVILVSFDLIKESFNPTFILILMTGFGIFGVAMILLGRPSLKSWFTQNYIEDDIYYSSNADRKVFIWCFSPIIISAFWAVNYWYQNGCLPNSLSINNFILFSLILFLGGFALSIYFLFKHYKELNEKQIADDSPNSLGRKITKFIEKNALFFEFFFSLICGIVGGFLLYLAAKYFYSLAIPFDKFFGKIPENLIFVCFGLPVFLTIFLFSATLYVGLVSKITNDMDREWVSRFGGWVLFAIVGWLVISITVLFGHRLFVSGSESYDYIKNIITSIGGVSGLFALIGGFSEKSSVTETPKKETWKDTLAKFAPAIAAPIFILVLIAFISFLSLELLKKTDDVFGRANTFIWCLGLLGFGLLMGLFININKFSLHAIYRERIIRAFLGASNKKFLKNANSYTGLDSDNDNFEMRSLRNNKPFHVVNMTLNLSKPHNLAWQTRKAESFTVTPLYCGSSNMGGSGNYRPTEKYGGFNSQNQKPISLGTAVAISGAAANPNMGYYTFSPAVTFLMVLFNIRLGWWLGNTGLRGKDSWQLSNPDWSPKIFFAEALGLTTDKRRYINLSDGGHFENLGIYEMVLRRCHLILVCDSGADASFSFPDFANAIHKIRVDLGISIKFDPGKAPKEGRNCAIGKIKYSDVDGKNAQDGTLIYIKPTLDGNEPIDLINYKKKNTTFPHETTADQFFGETQFESYRTLGFHQIDSILKIKCQNVLEVKKCAEEYLKELNKDKKDDKTEPIYSTKGRLKNKTTSFD